MTNACKIVTIVLITEYNMSSTVNLQVRLPQSLKKEAEELAIEEGFSSLQELVRVFIAQYKNKKTSFRFRNEISDEAAERYFKISEELYKAASKNEINTLKSPKDAINYLNKI